MHALAGLAFIAIVLLPFLLFPTIAAHMNGKRRSGGIALANVLLLAAVGYDLYALGEPGMKPLPVPGILIWWLILLGIGIRKDDPAPAALDETVELVPHDPSWPAKFAAERARLADTLTLPADDFEHIGSTAVPGLSAKPVIDMMLGVPQLSRTREIISRLGILGYENFGAAGVPGRIYLRLRGQRSFNLHLVERGGEHWTNNLALRELLRADPAARARYAAGKRAALESGGDRLLAYSAAKNAVVTELLAAARQR